MASPETSNVETTSDSILPSGSRLLTSFPDLLMLPELVSVNSFTNQEIVTDLGLSYIDIVETLSFL